MLGWTVPAVAPLQVPLLLQLPLPPSLPHLRPRRLIPLRLPLLSQLLPRQQPPSQLLPTSWLPLAVPGPASGVLRRRAAAALPDPAATTCAPSGSARSEPL